MILISSDQYDSSTNHVIDWLTSFKKQFIRINKNDDYKISFINSKLNLNFQGKSIDFNTIKGYFYRRGKIHHKQGDNSIVYLSDISKEHSQIIDEYINFILENKV
jgi:hypothetical protein